MTPVLPPFVDIYIGLDIGQTDDYTAAAVLERGGPPGDRRYDVVGLQRVRHRLYPDVVRAVQTLVANPAFRPIRLVPADDRGPERLEWAPRPVLAIDSTGPGEGVTDDFLVAPMAATLVPIKIRGGDGYTRGPWPGKANIVGYKVSKGALCSSVQSLLQSGRLRISPRLELADTLREELYNFQVKVSEAGNESYGAWRSGKHDDLVLACAMAAWLADLRPVVNTLVVGPNFLEGYRGSGWGIRGGPGGQADRRKRPPRGR